MPLGHCYIFFGEKRLWRKVYLGLLPIFLMSCLGVSLLLLLLLLSCMICFYILEINPLSVILFANICSHSMGCLFALFVVSFAVQKLLSLIKSHLFIFAFISITVRNRSKKTLLQFLSKVSLPMSSSSVIRLLMTLQSAFLHLSTHWPYHCYSKCR